MNPEKFIINEVLYDNELISWANFLMNVNWKLLKNNG